MATVTESIDTSEKSKARGLYANQLIVILVLSLLTAALLILAYFVSGAFRREQVRLGAEYFQRGQTALADFRADQAVADFRTALSFAPDNRFYRLRLAQALVLSNHDKEALAHFRELWEREPGDGEVNLELARLAAHSGNMADALRFYHGAVYGLWSGDPEESRQKAWLELIGLLLSQHADTQAQSELLALSASVPARTSLNLNLASMFMRAGDDSHALSFYRSVLKTDRENQAALIGAGEASLALGDFRAAVEYFKDAARHFELPSNVQSDAQVAEFASQADPFGKALSAMERRRRATAAFAVAGDRLHGCIQSKGETSPPPPGRSPSRLQTDDVQWNALGKQVTEQSLRRDSDVIYSAMDLVFRVEEDTAAVCGEPTGKDKALLMLGRHRSGMGR